MLNKNKLEILVNKIKMRIFNDISKNHIEASISQISTCAKILYETNQIYYDYDLESYLLEISNKINLKVPNYSPKKDTILFFDSFGLNNRGLAQIYLKALSNIGNVIYVTYSDNKNKIPTLKSILKSNSKNKVYFLESKNYLERINKLAQIFENERPMHIINYSTPWEVVLPIVGYFYKDFTKRYLINLTDHAFWLGSQFIDYCVEFRDYGAYISNKYRNISKDKIVCLPYYPVIDTNKEFEGFPFPYDETKQKIVFSGGNIYKTIGKDNLYYKIVDHILSKHSDVILWYAGSGNPLLYDNFNKLKEKYPNQLYITTERKDLFQILEKCYFYLSTYPLGGGLMTQYAAVAKKIPITLKFDTVLNGLLINQNNLGIIFDSYDEVINEIDKILENEAYLKSKESKLEGSVISEREFQEQLLLLLESGRTKYNLEFKPVDTDNFRKEYLLRLNIDEIYTYTARDKYLLSSLPIQYIAGQLYRIKSKCMWLITKMKEGLK